MEDNYFFCILVESLVAIAYRASLFCTYEHIYNILT